MGYGSLPQTCHWVESPRLHHTRLRRLCCWTRRRPGLQQLPQVRRPMDSRRYSCLLANAAQYHGESNDSAVQPQNLGNLYSGSSPPDSREGAVSSPSPSSQAHCIGPWWHGMPSGGDGYHHSPALCPSSCGCCTSIRSSGNPLIGNVAGSRDEVSQDCEAHPQVILILPLQEQLNSTVGRYQRHPVSLLKRTSICVNEERFSCNTKLKKYKVHPRKKKRKKKKEKGPPGKKKKKKKKKKK